MELYGFILIFLLLAFMLLLKNFWKNQHIYYCAWKLPGPLTLPFVGSIVLMQSAYKDFYPMFLQICERQKSIFKLGILNELYVVNSDPEDVEILLNSCLGRTPFYDFWNKLVSDTASLMTAPAHIWKNKRREFTRCFNSKIVQTDYETFLKYSKETVKMFNQTCGQVQTNFLFDVWKCNMDVFFETFGDFDPQLIEERYDLLKLVVRAEEIIVEKFQKPWLMVDCIFELSRLRKETTLVAEETFKIGEKVYNLKQKQFSDDGDILKDELRMKRFVNHLFITSTLEHFQAEGNIMAVAATETSAIAITTVVLILGILQNVQEKVYQEISSMSNDFSLDDINRMNYLERVIKETFRLFPVAPLIMRSVDEDTKLKSYVQPAGSHVIVPIIQIHRNPELWPDPLKFDPDRFLPEQVEKRHRCAYLPFSYGPRNCIGMKVAMMSVKSMVAQLVREFVIKTLDINSVEDIEVEYKYVLHPKNYKIVFEKRSK